MCAEFSTVIYFDFVGRELSKSTSIFLQNIPEKYYAKEFLSDFFSKFGVIIKLSLDPSYSATITFVNHGAARQAMEQGCTLEDGEAPILISMKSDEAEFPGVAKKAPKVGKNIF